MRKTDRPPDRKATVTLSVRKPTPEDLVGKELDGFSVQRYTEVYLTDDDGRKTKSLGYFKDDSIATAFARNQTDAAWHKTEKVLLLTDGKVGFLVGDSVHLMDDEKAALEVRKNALSKLSPEERKALGV